MLKLRGFEVTNDLRLMFGTKSLGCFEFNNQNIIDEQIRDVFSYQSSIFVKYHNWMLLFYVHPALARRCASAFS